MTEKYAELDAALERVVTAARAHLAAVKAAEGEPDDDAVWRAYVMLNNFSREYDERLNEVFGEVTPWDLEEISMQERPGLLTTAGASSTLGTGTGTDAHDAVISVRQRRDYRVPSVSALARAAEAVRVVAGGEADVGPESASVVESVLELLQSGDGSLSMLDVPELEPLDGLVVIAEVGTALDPEAYEEDDAQAPFQLAEGDRFMARLDERLVVDLAGDEKIETAR